MQIEDPNGAQSTGEEMELLNPIGGHQPIDEEENVGEKSKEGSYFDVLLDGCG